MISCQARLITEGKELAVMETLTVYGGKLIKILVTDTNIQVEFEDKTSETPEEYMYDTSTIEISLSQGER